MRPSKASSRSDSDANKPDPIFIKPICRGATMTRAPAEEIVEFLRFSNDSGDRVTALNKLTARNWKQSIPWLDDSGLAFYFLQKLKVNKSSDAVPAWAVEKLENNFAHNQARVAHMARQFAILNDKFTNAGVRFAVLKGVSLVPQFCPDATLRHQGDFDYLIDEHGLPAARQVLVDAGYIAKSPSSRQEFIFVTPGKSAPSRSGEQYQAHSPHAVELHLDIWDSEAVELPALPQLFSVERTCVHQWNGLSFPALTGEDAFLLQVLHACGHLFTCWIRTSNLFEIAYFLDRQASDESFWNQIDRRVGNNLLLREFVVLTTELAAGLFGAPAPPLVRSWSGALRPGARVWIEHYAQSWALCELPVHDLLLFPKAKLALFLHQQYSGTASQVGVTRKRLLPVSRLSQISRTLKIKPSLLLDANWRKRQRLIRKTVYHTLAGFRYLCEIPRWLWLNRAARRKVLLDSRFPVGKDSSPLPGSIEF